jgi:hypothetical protein
MTLATRGGRGREGERFCNGHGRRMLSMLVRKTGGIDNGTLYAMKAVAFCDMMKLTNGREQIDTERYVHERGSESPFLVGLGYTIQTPSKMFLFVGEYINNCSRFHDV